MKPSKRFRKNRPFDTIGQRMAELSESKAAGNISESEYEGSINKLLMYQDKQEGFYRVYEQVMYLEAIHEATGIGYGYWIPSVIIGFFYKF